LILATAVVIATVIATAVVITSAQKIAICQAQNKNYYDKYPNPTAVIISAVISA